jgi:hypothetical protein
VAELLAVLSGAFVIRGEEHYLGASIGISVFPEDGRTPDKPCATPIAMRAKGRGQCASSTSA